ncbi:MAG: hypothetical protein OXI22_09840 [Defluviicoccus sp.]|nr:hypothetical protein [Defluviicoccus sp.]MDE0384174.1 hypothetical protein [Defluviicoccus sp.]
MLIVLNIDPKLLAELLVTASMARSKAVPGRGERAIPGPGPARPAGEPAVTDGGKARHVRAAR